MTWYDDRVRNKAFSLYCQGVPLEAISKKHFNGRPTKATLWQWLKEDNWKQRKQELDQRVDEELNETLTQIKTRQRKIMRGIASKFIKDIQPIPIRDKAGNIIGEEPSKVNIGVGDMINLFKHEMLLAGEATERLDGSVTILDLLEAAKKTEKKLLVAHNSGHKDYRENYK